MKRIIFIILIISCLSACSKIETDMDTLKRDVETKVTEIIDAAEIEGE